MKGNRSLFIFLLITLFTLTSCAPRLNPQAQHSETVQAQLAAHIASLVDEEDEEPFIDPETTRAMGGMTKASLIQKSRDKRMDSSLFHTNEKILRAHGKHSKIYPFIGDYRVMVIPVEFSDVKFADRDFFSPSKEGRIEAQDYLFGESKNSLTSYYKHASFGNLKLQGEVTPIVTLNKTLKFYGEATRSGSDRYANGLVIDALKKLKKLKTNDQWWLSFDQWDLSDYDRDKNFHEADGFIDAVVVVYAGRSQASCQRAFDPDGKRPSSASVPAGPRQRASVECFNRLWPHRWVVNMKRSDPDFTTKGPVLEGHQRPAMNGLKINDRLFALDYNMQSEFSDRSTFIHEFGHSLSLPDIYSSGKANSTGGWDVMSSNANLQGQEMSSYSKISLGWLAPKVIEQGEESEAYLGAYNFIPQDQREKSSQYEGPHLNENSESILSKIPNTDEDVYRSVMVITDPSEEYKKVIRHNSQMGDVSAYSSKFDAGVRELKFKVPVPNSGEAKISFDTFYHVETETNFDTKASTVRVITDYDYGQVFIDGEAVELLRLMSGDKNQNSLNESHPTCDEELVLKLRKKKIAKTISRGERRTFGRAIDQCRKPTWIKKSYDLSSYRGRTIDFSIRYTTDDYTNELGIIVDNIKLPNGELIDFERRSDLGEFKPLVRGREVISFSQYYLLEHRLPGENYHRGEKEVSYNMDNNIQFGSQSFFLAEGENPAEKFRMVTFDYQPGVLVWYFNSKFGRSSRSNTPVRNEGRGYLLVLNSKVGELELPGIFDRELYFDETQAYPKVDLNDKKADNELEELVRAQRDTFICFAYTKYATYQKGVRPECDEEFKDYMQTLTFQGKALVYRRERFNQLLPIDRYATHGVGKPFRVGASIRTGLSTFRPSDAEAFSPFKVYKEHEGKMVLDDKLTARSYKARPISLYDDARNSLPKNKLFHGDSVVVEKRGFQFEVLSPESQILESYTKEAESSSHQSLFRAPRSKVLIRWN